MALIKHKIVAEINLDTQMIEVKSEVTESQVKNVIHEAGYETV
jgi:hypothetical protein